jgi:hypothetical protein
MGATTQAAARGREVGTAAVLLFACLASAQELPPPDTRTKPRPRPKVEEKKPGAPAGAAGSPAAAPAAAPVLLLTSDLPCSLTLNGEPLATLPAKEIRRVNVAAGQHLLVATSSDGRLRWEKVVDAKPGQQVVQIELATAGAVFSTDDFDRAMAGVWLGTSDVKVAGEYATSILSRAWGFHNHSLSTALHTAHQYLKRQVEELAKMAPADPGRKRMSEDVQRIAQDADKYIELMTKSVADAQKANSWQGEPSNLFGQARALEPGIAFPDSALGTLRASKAFVEALPPDRRAELGLPGDPRDFNLGARYYQSTPALLAVVPKGSLADKLGFRAGDRLVTIDGAPAASVWSLKLAMRARSGRKLPVVIEREGKQERRELAVPATLP